MRSGRNSSRAFAPPVPTTSASLSPSRRADHAQFDLAGYIAALLDRAGIDRVEDLGVCTYADPRFYSYRRSVHRAEGDYGRHINAMYNHTNPRARV